MRAADNSRQDGRPRGAGHLLRILTATYLGLEAVDGKMFALDAGGIGVLGHERVQPVIAGWTSPPTVWQTW